MQLYFYNGQPTNYSVTEDGRVFSHFKNDFITGSQNKNGYRSYSISLGNGISKRLYGHRMIAETFIPNPNNLPEVNHIDGNKQNNRVENLEWVTSSQNKQHALKTGLYDNKLQKVYCFSEDRKLIKEYFSLAEACRELNATHSNLCNALNAKEKTLSYGCYWCKENNPNFKILVVTSGKAKAVNQYDLQGNFIKRYDSFSAAARATGLNRTHIGECCNGKGRTYGGFIWKYDM